MSPLKKSAKPKTNPLYLHHISETQCCHQIVVDDYLTLFVATKNGSNSCKMPRLPSCLANKVISRDFPGFPGNGFSFLDFPGNEKWSRNEIPTVDCSSQYTH